MNQTKMEGGTEQHLPKTDNWRLQVSVVRYRNETWCIREFSQIKYLNFYINK